MSEERLSRREIIKTAAYITPIIITMKANFSFASAGSGEPENSVEHIDKGKPSGTSIEHEYIDKRKAS